LSQKHLKQQGWNLMEVFEKVHPCLK